MVSLRSLFDAVKSPNSVSEEDGDATEYHELLEDTECASCAVNEFQELRQPALKGSNVLQNWSANSNPCRIIQMRELVSRCPEVVMDITSISSETQTKEQFQKENPMHGRGKVVTALNIMDAKLEDVEIDMENEKIHLRAGALRARDIVRQKPYSGDYPQVTTFELQTIKCYGLLLTATLMAAITFHAALRAPSPVSETSFNESSLFILFNSMAFFTSLALITILTYELPIKPWLLILLFSTIGAYMCLIITISPNEVVPVFFIGSTIFLATFIRCLALDKILIDHLQLIYTRIHII